MLAEDEENYRQAGEACVRVRSGEGNVCLNLDSLTKLLHLKQELHTHTHTAAPCSAVSAVAGRLSVVNETTKWKNTGVTDTIPRFMN